MKAKNKKRKVMRRKWKVIWGMKELKGWNSRLRKRMKKSMKKNMVGVMVEVIKLWSMKRRRMMRWMGKKWKSR